jgi:hypothetical protein
MPGAAPASVSAASGAPAPEGCIAHAATLQCFRAGTHVSMAGEQITFTAADLAATAGAYDPALHEAPIVVGHPQLDAPAYGWVSGLAYRDGALEATPVQVDAEFANMVDDGRFKKISAAFWGPTAPGNPVPGVYYLRHVGFLGAAAPAVKGLRRPSFGAESEEGVVEFSAWDETHTASLWRSLRDWVLGKFGLKDADAALPSWRVQELERMATDSMREEAATEAAEVTAAAVSPPAFAAAAASSQPEITTVTDAEKQALEAQIASLQQQLATQAAEARRTRMAAAHAEAVAFADGLVAQGRMAAGHRDLIVAVQDTVAEQAETAGAAVQFGEGEARAPLLPALRELLAALPPLVPAGRLATGDRAAPGAGAGAGAEAVAFAGATSPDRLAIHQRARALMQADPKLTYLAAVRVAEQAGG